MHSKLTSPRSAARSTYEIIFSTAVSVNVCFRKQIVDLVVDADVQKTQPADDTQVSPQS